MNAAVPGTSSDAAPASSAPPLADVERHRRGEADPDAERELPRGAGEHAREDAARRGTERRADPDLAAPLVHGERHQRVDPGRREEEHAPRDERDDGRDARADLRVFAVQRVERLHGGELQHRVDRGGDAPQRRRERLGGLRAQPDREQVAGAELPGRRRAEDPRAARLPRLLDGGGEVLDDADDDVPRVDRVVVAPVAHAAPDRVAAAEDVGDEAPVDDDRSVPRVERGVRAAKFRPANTGTSNRPK
jgi:hypothetical protein